MGGELDRGPRADRRQAARRRQDARRPRSRALTYQPEELANGANGLLDEVAASKITGEEDRYSHTDLSDFAGQRRRRADDVRPARARAARQGPRSWRSRHRRPLRRRPRPSSRRSSRAASSRATTRSTTPSASELSDLVGRAGQAAVARSRTRSASDRARWSAAVVGLLVLAAPAGAATLPGDIGAPLPPGGARARRHARRAPRTETRLMREARPRLHEARRDASTARATSSARGRWPNEVDALAPPARAPKADDYAAIRRDLDAGRDAGRVSTPRSAAARRVRRPRAQRRRVGPPDRARPGRSRRHEAARSSPRSTPPSRPTATSRSATAPSSPTRRSSSSARVWRRC